MRYISLITGLAGLVLAQSQWFSVIGGNSDDRGHCVLRVADGGFMVAGGLQSYSPAYLRFMLSKTDSVGNHIWTTTVDVSTTDRDYAISLIQTSDGGFAASGRTWINYYDMLLVKYNSSGNPQWVRTLALGDFEYGYSLIEDGDGGIIVADRTTTISGNGDVLITKFNSSGTWLWSRRIGGSGDDGAQCIIRTSDGGYAITGWTDSYGAGAYDILVMKFDPSWNISWTKTIGGGGYDLGFSLIQTSDGNFAILGQTESFGAGGRDIILTRLDASGNHIWTRTIGGPGNDDMGGDLGSLYGGRQLIVQTPDGGLELIGSTESYGVGGPDILVSKFDINGNQIWTRVLGGASYDYGHSITNASGNTLAIAGMSQSYYYGSWDIVMARLDAGGNNCAGSFIAPTVTSRTPTMTNPSLSPVSVTPTVSSPSYTTANPTPLDSMVCQQSVNISEKEELSTRLWIEKGRVIFSLASESWARLTVYDATGRLVARPIDGILRAGEHAVELDDLQKGVYLVQLDVGTSNTEPARAKLVIR
ncbi:MAG: T9SS type A sorting domain-containing protein [candidate division WOR-3 bacterium]